MTTTRADLRELAAALRKALGAGAPSQQPVVDTDWRARWPTLTELGVTAFCATEECGGFGDEAPAALTAARELGAALHGAPYAGVVAAAHALSRWLDDPRRPALLEEIGAGEHIPALAFLDPAATVVERDGEVRVDGRAYLVAGAEEADSFLCLPPDGDTMVFVPRAGTCTAQSSHAFDVTRSCADIAFTGAQGSPVRAEPGGRLRVERLHGLLLAGDALGGLERMLERTVGHARERKAFGKAIGGFQAVQHRLVDHTVRLRGVSLLAEAAADRLGTGAPDAGRTVLLAEAAVAEGAVPMLHDLLQLTGAIGFTWEYGLHLYERRAHLDARLGRNPRQALRSIARHEGWSGGGRPAGSASADPSGRHVPTW
ncbi:acyl-CoA dehydrogenase family protein [Actinomadura rugatobispora]|uniref:Acyl-CoA dehydrogenase family protein n=1 Tax=Actinomadura rugatobispora TaxID=1994 RepID=A0ABW1AIV1_9ACTN|nr:acyl-CoA dehydrogenase family protein [Actinomadura rugatobispora]